MSNETGQGQTEQDLTTKPDPGRREIFSRIYRSKAKNRLGGEPKSYYTTQQEGKADKETVKPNKEAQRALYALALVTDSLLDTMRPHDTSGATYRQALEARQKELEALRAKRQALFGERDSAERQIKIAEANDQIKHEAKRVLALRKEFNLNLKEALSSPVKLDPKRHEAARAMQDKLESTKSTSIQDRITRFQRGLSTKTKSITDVTKKRMESLFQGVSQDKLAPYALKGVDLMLRRGGLAESSKKQAEDTSNGDRARDDDTNPTIDTPQIAPSSEDRPQTEDDENNDGGDDPNPPSNPEKRFVGVLANDTDSVAQLVTLNAQEEVNEGLRQRKWWKGTDWIRKALNRNFETVLRQQKVESAMRALRNNKKRGFWSNNKTQDKIAKDVMGSLDRSSEATAQRLAMMDKDQARSQGEDRIVLNKDNGLRKKLIKDIVEPAAQGRTFSKEWLQDYFTELLANKDFGNDPNLKELFGAGKSEYGFAAQNFASNLVKMGEEIHVFLGRQENAHLKGVEAIDDKIDIVLARARANVHGNTHDAIDQMVVKARRLNERLGTSLLGRSGLFPLTHPAIVGIGTTLALRSVTLPGSILGKSLAPLAPFAPFTPFAAGVIVATAASGIRRNREVGRDNRFTEVSMGMGRVSEERNRASYQEIFARRQSTTAESLLNGGGGKDAVLIEDRKSVEHIVRKLKNNKDNAQAKAEAQSRLAEIIIRERISRSSNKPLVTFSDGNAAEERMKLVKAENDLMKALGYNALHPATSRETFLRDNVGGQMKTWESSLTTSQAEADRSLRIKRFKEVTKAMTWSAGMSIIGGLAAQEVLVFGQTLKAEHLDGRGHVYVGPTLLERMQHGVAERTGLPKFRETPLGIESFREAFSNNSDLKLPHGLILRPDGPKIDNLQPLTLRHTDGTPFVDTQGKPLTIPAFLRDDGTIQVNADLNKLNNFPLDVKGSLESLNPSLVNTPEADKMLQILHNANTGNEALITFPGQQAIKVVPGGKFWLPPDPTHPEVGSVMGQIKSDGTIAFTGNPQGVQAAREILKQNGFSLSEVKVTNNLSLHERLTNLVHSQTSGSITTDDGRFEISYNSDKSVSLRDLAKPNDPPLQGKWYVDQETNPTNYSRPGGARGKLVNFSFDRQAFNNTSAEIREELRLSGFTGRGFNAPEPLAQGYQIPLEGNTIALAAPDTSINATMSASLPLPKMTILTPPELEAALPAIPTPFDPRKPLGGYGKEQKENKASAKTPKTEAVNASSEPEPAPTTNTSEQKADEAEETPMQESPETQLRNLLDNPNFPEDIRQNFKQRASKAGDDKEKGREVTKQLALEIEARRTSIQGSDSEEMKKQNKALEETSKFLSNHTTISHSATPEPDKEKKAPPKTEAKKPGLIAQARTIFSSKARKPVSAKS